MTTKKVTRRDRDTTTGIDWAVIDYMTKIEMDLVADDVGLCPFLLDPLRAAAALATVAADRIEHHVLELRRKEVPWEAIGQAIGISKQGAQQRFRNLQVDLLDEAAKS